MTIREGKIRAGDLEFAYLEAGEGPLVLLLHGFPDNAWTWERQLLALGEAGHRAVAPFMRGYPPTQIPADGRFDLGTLANDVVALADALGAPAFDLIGHDQGAMATHAALALTPVRIRRAAALGVGHPLTFARLFDSPPLVGHLAHMWFFQLQQLAAVAVRANDFAFVDYLWEHLSEAEVDAAHVRRVRDQTITRPGALEAALAYYPGFVGQGPANPELSEGLAQPVQVPTLALYGAQDPVRVIYAEEEALFEAPYRQVLIHGAGHWVHLEQPDQVTPLLLDWLAA